jgi:hypothetical protein
MQADTGKEPFRNLVLQSGPDIIWIYLPNIKKEKVSVTPNTGTTLHVTYHIKIISA